MTHLSVFGPGFNRDFDKFFVGFDDEFARIAKMQDSLTKNSSYPPYNIKKTGDNTYVIEIAVAGFSQSDIEVDVNDGKLVVKGNSHDDQKAEYLFNGIANRGFTRTFGLQEFVEVNDAELSNGMLKIYLERVIPDHKKPKKIEVKTHNGQQLLRE